MKLLKGEAGGYAEAATIASFFRGLDIVADYPALGLEFFDTLYWSRDESVGVIRFSLSSSMMSRFMLVRTAGL